MFKYCLTLVLAELSSVSSSSFLSENLIGVGIGVLALVTGGIYFFNRSQVKLPQDVTDRAKILTDKLQEETGEIATLAQDKINVIIEEYKRLLPYMEELGLSVEGFSIEAGILPQIKTSLRGSIENIKVEAIERIKDENKTNPLLVSILNALLMAKKSHEKLESVYISILKDIVIDVKLGIPPSIVMRFQ